MKTYFNLKVRAGFGDTKEHTIKCLLDVMDSGKNWLHLISKDGNRWYAINRKIGKYKTNRVSKTTLRQLNKVMKAYEKISKYIV